MKRRVAALLAAGVLAGAPAGADAASKTVTLSGAYETPAIGWSISNYSEVTEYDCEQRIGCVTFELPRGYRFASVKIADASGTNARALVPAVRYGEVCGETEYPLKIEGLTELSFIVVTGLCTDDETPSTPTQGTIEVTLARTPAALGHAR